MANDTKLNVIVDNTQAIPAIEETGKAVVELKEKSSGASEGTKKDWGGVADLFSSVLPRSLSKSMRSFKSTGRQVGRLSRSFKGLKGAIASTGIGLLIIALGELVANWEAVSYAIGLTNKEQEENKKRNEEIETSQKALNREMIAYIDLISQSATSDEERAIAIATVNQQLGNAIDLEADRATQTAQAQALLDQNIIIIEKQRTETDALNKAKEDTVKLNKELEDFTPRYNSQGILISITRNEKRLQIAEKIKAVDDAAFKATQDRVKEEGELNKIIDKTRKTIEERADAERTAAQEQADAERKAAAARAKRKALRESNAAFLLQLEKDLNEQILLAGIEGEQKRAEKVLELRHKEGYEKARIAGATAEQLLLIEEGYELDLAALKARFKDDLPDPQDIIDDQEALREELRRADLLENEKDVQQAQDLYDERVELAHGNRELEKEAEELFESEIDAIEVFYRDKKAADDQAARDKEIADDEQVRNLKIKGFSQIANASRSLFSEMEGLAEENSAEQKALAITGILLAQAVSVANAIKTATASAATPYDLAAGIIVAISSVMSAFIGVKKILSQADVGGLDVDDGGGGGRNPTVPLIPLGRLDSPDTNNQAYVVQSQLEGQNLNARQLEMQTVL